MSSLRVWGIRPALRVVALLVGAVGLVWLLLPWPLVYRWRDPETTSFMQYREWQAEEEGRAWVVRHEWVSLDHISPAVIRAVVAAEDGRFRDHGGVDWVALGEEIRYEADGSFSWLDPRDLRALGDALRYGWTHRNDLRGRSTITQQLAKNLYFTPERSFGRKVAELVVAWRLEWLLGKDRILELYLNSVELGPGVFGVEAAAREYFGTSAASLRTWEAASLAATLPHPLTSNPGHRPARMAWRRARILERLRAPASEDRSSVPAAPPEPAVPPSPAAPGDTGASPDTGVGAPDTIGGPRDRLPVPPDTAAAPPDTGLARPDTTAVPPDDALPVAHGTTGSRGAVRPPGEGVADPRGVASRRREPQNRSPATAPGPEGRRSDAPAGRSTGGSP